MEKMDIALTNILNKRTSNKQKKCTKDCRHPPTVEWKNNFFDGFKVRVNLCHLCQQIHHVQLPDLTRESKRIRGKLRIEITTEDIDWPPPLSLSTRLCYTQEQASSKMKLNHESGKLQRGLKPTVPGKVLFRELAWKGDNIFTAKKKWEWATIELRLRYVLRFRTPTWKWKW